MVIRADANVNIGIGHAMRVTALGAALVKTGAEVIFVYQSCPMAVANKIQSYGIHLKQLETESAETLASFSSDKHCIGELFSIASQDDFIVLDGYQYTAKDQQEIKDSGRLLLVLDDYGHCEHYLADLILNQNYGASVALYPSINKNTKLLLGSDYVLLRPEFLEIERKGQISDSPQSIYAVAVTQKHRYRILITMGGADNENATGMVLEGLLGALRETKCSAEITVVLGAANPNRQELEKLITEALCELSIERQKLQVGIKLVVDATNMAKLMQEQNVIISAGGTTVSEAAYLGIANLVLTIADNQLITNDLAKEGAIYSLGCYKDCSAKQITQKLSALIESNRLATVSKIAQSLVDGDGVHRVIKAMNAVATSAGRS